MFLTERIDERQLGGGLGQHSKLATVTSVGGRHVSLPTESSLGDNVKDFGQHSDHHHHHHHHHSFLGKMMRSFHHHHHHRHGKHAEHNTNDDNNNHKDVLMVPAVSTPDKASMAAAAVVVDTAQEPVPARRRKSQPARSKSKRHVVDTGVLSLRHLNKLTRQAESLEEQPEISKIKVVGSFCFENTHTRTQG